MSSRLTGFVTLGPRISLFTPSQPRTGELVVICTWLGALPKHLAKYVKLYQDTAPGARILLIESNVPILISSYKHQREMIKPAVAVVLESLSSSNDEQIPPKILLHTFSNGGTNTATQLLIVTQERLSAPIPFAGLVFDSCPSKGTYWKSYDAMMLSLPKNATSNILGPVIIHGILVLLYSWIYYGNENPASLQRRTLLDKQTVRALPKPNLGDGHASCTDGEQRQKAYYLYSKTDRMCDWKDIRDHADDARKAGYCVQELVFEGSSHCAHLFKDPARYGEAIKSMWEGNDVFTLGKSNIQSKL